VYRLLLPVIALIVYGSLYPWHFDFGRAGPNPFWMLLHSWPATFDRFALRDAAVNVLLYCPLGITAYLAMVRRHARAAAIACAALLGLALSASIEMLQLYDAHRVCSLFDVATNVAAATLGAFAALVFERQLANLGGRHHVPHARHARRGAASALVLAGCWAGYQLYPLFPVLSRTHLRIAISRMLHSAVSPVETMAWAAEWFAFALVMRALFGRVRLVWLALAMACLPLHLVIADRGLTVSELLGAALAFLLWSVLPEPVRPRAGAWMLALAVLLRELAPFHLSATPHAFSWVPFGAALASEPGPAALVLFRKAYEYGGLVWMLRARGMSYVGAGAAVIAGLAILESAQCYLPGRYPEITDPFLALLMTLVMWVASKAGT
jgi:VanZ family protein